jgi:hypothetical protein
MTYSKTVTVGEFVTITKPGKQNGNWGMIEAITNEDLVLVRTDGGSLVPCKFNEIEEG